MDDDNDGYLDSIDDCPFDPNENLDTDGDGYCNVQDTDDDGDGVYDWNDLYPLDPTESADADGDGIGDNADPMTTTTEHLIHQTRSLTTPQRTLTTTATTSATMPIQTTTTMV